MLVLAGGQRQAGEHQDEEVFHGFSRGESAMILKKQSAARTAVIRADAGTPINALRKLNGISNWRVWHSTPAVWFDRPVTLIVFPLFAKPSRQWIVWKTAFTHFRVAISLNGS